MHNMEDHRGQLRLWCKNSFDGSFKKLNVSMNNIEEFKFEKVFNSCGEATVLVFLSAYKISKSLYFYGYHEYEIFHMTFSF